MRRPIRSLVIAAFRLKVRRNISQPMYAVLYVCIGCTACVLIVLFMQEMNPLLIDPFGPRRRRVAIEAVQKFQGAQENSLALPVARALQVPVWMSCFNPVRPGDFRNKKNHVSSRLREGRSPFSQSIYSI